MLANLNASYLTIGKTGNLNNNSQKRWLLQQFYAVTVSRKSGYLKVSPKKSKNLKFGLLRFLRFL